MSEEKTAPGDKGFVMNDGEEAKETPSYSMPELTFSTFVFSLNSSALVHLGVINDPSSNRNIKDLALAKQTIDILGILEEKTTGNLSEDEAKLLKNILHDLRIMYVKAKG